LQRIAQGLPEAGAIDRLRRLTDLRWIVVHRTSMPMRKHWERAVNRGLVDLVFSEPNVRIYRVPELPDGGELLDALASDSPRSRTFAGLSRAPLDVSRAIGRIRVATSATMMYQHATGMESWVELDIRNDSAANWPGFDIQTEGLIELRYRFIDDVGIVTHEDTAALDTDVMAGREVRTQVVVRAPARDGLYTVRFDLVQRIGDELFALPVASVDREIRVERASMASSRMRDELRVRGRDPTRMQNNAPQNPSSQGDR